ncbi:vesicular-fusion protein S17 [Polyrhizophydium stewartii]|uniref:Vesicular-fusion protein S17 n=1 Tax=Polyrhizophydium stewartii TaxID=2732419 RepID=A0ABR4NJD6_9FUNG
MASSTDGPGLLAEAERKLKAKGMFGFGGPKLDEAADLFGRAANAFKLSKKWKDSGDAFVQQAQTLERMGDRDDAASAYINASKSYKKEHPRDAVVALETAVKFLTEKGRFSAAANNMKQVAEIYETDIADMEKAMHAYEQAAEWYSGEDSNAQANACMLKVATFAGTLEMYDRAIDLFERVASKSVDNNLTKWSVRDYLFKAGICVLCTGDNVRARNSLDRYQSLDATFSETRECKLLLALLDAIEAGDVEAFTASLRDFDRLSKLDEWKTSLLLRVKNKLDAQEADFT